MVLLEAAAVVGLVGLVVYGLVLALARAGGDRPAALRGGTWQVVHYESAGATRVVVQKVSANGVNVLDEHLVATVPVDDPDYDQKFLAAMSAARERCALFAAEEDP